MGMDVVWRRMDACGGEISFPWWVASDKTGNNLPASEIT